MELKVVSWNIRHFRKSKISDFIHTLWEVLVWADVAFIYEDHTGIGSLLASELNKYGKKQNKNTSHWAGDEIRTTDKYVAVIWNRPIA